MAGPSDFDDSEVTPEPVVLHPDMSKTEAELVLALNENQRLRLQIAALRAEKDELLTQILRLKQTIVTRAKGGK